MNFSRNNIGFRCVSSSAQAKFLESKSFILTQMCSGQKHDFNSSAREVVLQLYQIWTETLFEIEKYLVHSGKRRIDQDAVQQFIRLAKKKNLTFKIHLTKDESWYEDDFLKPFGEIHHLMCEEFYRGFSKSLLGQNIETGYRDFVVFLINHMMHLMFRVHELDYLLTSKNDDKYFCPFLYIGLIDINFYIERRENHVVDRYEIYKRHGLINSNKINLKVGIDKEILENNSEVEQAYNDLFSKIESYGLEIVSA